MNVDEIYVTETCGEILKEEPLEYRIAKAMVESKQIANGTIAGRKAEDLLDEL